MLDRTYFPIFDGDGSLVLLGLFWAILGYPAAHEDDGARAVRLPLDTADRTAIGSQKQEDGMAEANTIIQEIEAVYHHYIDVFINLGESP